MTSTKKKLTINALSAIIQVIITALLYFFLYKYLLEHLGVKQLGVWSLILSFSSIASLANFGITSGLVKFVAEYLAKDELEKLGRLIFTSLVTMTILFSLVSLLILFGAKYFIYLVIDKEFIEDALLILPFSLLSLCINALSGVFTSVLEGYQKNYLRNLVYILSNVVIFTFVILLTPAYHLKGIAMAQVIQSIFVFGCALLLILKINKHNRFRYWQCNRTTFRELFNYGYKFQIVSICQLLYEPTTKILISKYAGLSLLGHYEMAQRMVIQIRALIVNANQVVIPVIAESSINGTFLQKQQFFKKMNTLLFYAAITISSITIILTPFISFIWINSLEIDFCISVIILTISHVLMNNLSNPFYFSCLADGKLNILIKSHVVIALLNLILGYLASQFNTNYGAILAWGISSSIGSFMIIYGYSTHIKLKFNSMYKQKEKLFAGISIIFSLFTIEFLFQNNTIINIGIYTITAFILYLGIAFYFANKNTQIKRMIPQFIRI